MILRTIESSRASTTLGGDGAEGGRRAASRPRPGTRRLRRPVGARPARLRRARPAPGLAHRLPSRCRTSTRCSSASSAAARRRAPELRALVQHGFAHRRKALAALARARARRRPGHPRPRAARRSRRSGHARRRARRDARAGASGARCCGGAAMTLHAARPARSTSACSSARPRADGLHPLVSVVQPLVARRRARRSSRAGDATRSSAPASRARTSRRARSRAFRAATGWDGAAAAADDRQARSRSPPAWAAAPATPPPRCGSRAAAAGLPDARADARRCGSAPTSPRCSTPGRALMTGAGEHVEPLPGPEPLGLDRRPARRRALARREVYRESDARSRPRTPDELDAARRAALRTGDVRAPSTTSRTPPARCARPIDAALDALRAAGAEHALVSGSGPDRLRLSATTRERRPRARRARPARRRRAGRRAGRRREVHLARRARSLLAGWLIARRHKQQRWFAGRASSVVDRRRRR